MSQSASQPNVLVETRGRVGVIRFNRPQALNALNSALVVELNAALDTFEADEAIGCIVVTGSEKAFAAGADIKEMSDKSYMDVLLSDFAANQERKISKVQILQHNLQDSVDAIIAPYSLSDFIVNLALRLGEREGSDGLCENGVHGAWIVPWAVAGSGIDVGFPRTRHRLDVVEDDIRQGRGVRIRESLQHRGTMLVIV